MQIGAAAISKISEMICGDMPFQFFLYKISSYLTRYFVYLDIDYVHDGSIRRVWVREVFDEINKKQSPDNMPSPEMVKVIEYLLHPDHFLFDDNVDGDKALDAITKCLKTNDLTISIQANGTARLLPENGEFISTSFEEIPTERVITFKPSVFQVSQKKLNEKLISVMMSFNASYIYCIY
jgi:hypothetical protein